MVFVMLKIVAARSNLVRILLEKGFPPLATNVVSVGMTKRFYGK